MHMKSHAPHATASDDDDADLPVLVAGSGSTSLQRWVDLLATLLGRNSPATFEELAQGVPEYRAKVELRDRAVDAATKQKYAESLKRAFERDKDALRSMGVAIESHRDGVGNVAGAYRLKRTDFYLPYLCVAVPNGAPRSPARVDEYGYKTLESFLLEPDELAVIVDAAASVRGLGDPLLRTDVDSAMRKLAVDLPLDDASTSADIPQQIAARVQPDAKVFAELSEALRHRKVVTFMYHSMSSDAHDMRQVEPYGLFFLSAHWYLAGRDVARAELRNYRLARMTKVTCNTKSLQTPDFVVPATFRLRDHAQSRQVWELGDGEATEVLVDFTGDSGPALAAATLGATVDDAPARRRFMVRRADSFARWVLSFAGEARVASPPALANDVRGLARATLALYDADPVAALVSPAVTMPPNHVARQKWEPRGATAQFRRILLVVPQIADGEEHSLDDVARRIGTDVATLQQDLHSLVSRYDLPAGFIEGVQVYIGADSVSARSNHLRRPMRLTVSELCALELGLAVLRGQRPPDEHAVLDRARKRLQAVIARLPDDPTPDALYNISIGEYGGVNHMATVRAALRTRTRLTIGYRKSGAHATDDRVICPYALVAASGMLYLIAYCDRSASIRVFRMDRVQTAAATSVPFTLPQDFSVDDVMRDGRVFQGGEREVMVVRYSARIARWIAEREGRVPAADGTLVLEHPLADREWGMRHVLQYAADAEVLSPPALRVLLREQLAELIAQG